MKRLMCYQEEVTYTIMLSWIWTLYPPSQGQTTPVPLGYLKW